MIKRGRQRYWRGLMDVFEPRVLLSGWGVTEIAKFKGVGSLLSIGTGASISAPVADGDGNLYFLYDGGIAELKAGEGMPFMRATFGELGVAFDMVFASPRLYMDGAGDLYAYLVDSANGYLDTRMVELAKGSDQFQVVAQFHSTDGLGIPSAVTVDGAGNIFGVAGSTVFEMEKGTQSETTLATVAGLRSDFGVIGLTVDGKGDVFGQTLFDGPSGGGRIFEVKAGSGAATDLVDYAVVLGAAGLHPGYTFSLQLDGQGDLFAQASDNNGECLVEISGSDGTIKTVSDVGHYFRDFVMDGSGDIFAVDDGAHRNDVCEVVSGSDQVETIGHVDEAVGGVVGLAVDKDGHVFGVAETGYTLIEPAIWGYFPPPATAPVVFEVFPEGADHLAIHAPDLVHAPQGPTVTVDVLGPDGQIDTSDNELVTLFLNTGPYGGNLGGTVTVRAVNGVAKFDHLTLDVNGTYTVTATQWGVDSATSGQIHFTGGIDPISFPIGDPIWHGPIDFPILHGPILVTHLIPPVFLPPVGMLVVPQRVAAKVENVVDRGMSVNVVEQDEPVIAPVNQGFAYFGEALPVPAESGENVQKQALPAAVKGASADSDANAAVPVKDVPQAKDAAAAKEDAGQEQGKTEETPAQGEGAKKLEKKKEEKKGKDVGKVGIVGAGVVMMMGAERRRRSGAKDEREL